ncbi:MAG: alpha/beta fold hydrolase [Thermoanaerobaculia bacterium]
MPFLTLDDTRLHYDVEGSGPPILFCSATATHGDVWKFYQVPHFARDHRVITFDQRGTGQSTTSSQDFSTRRLAADAAALLQHLDAMPAIVCGHSNGGRVAQCLTVEHPQAVAKLVLMSSGGASRAQGIPLNLCKEMVELGYEPWVRDQAIRLGFTKDYVARHPDELERYLAVRLASPPPLETYLRHVIGRQAFDLGERVKQITVPTLVLVGDDEDHGPPGHLTHLVYARHLAQEIPGARFAMLPGQAHYYYFSDPTTTNRLIRQFAES